MRELGLFVDAGADVDVGVEGEVGEGMGEIGFLPRFKNLTKLSVRVSDIRGGNAVALFLSRLCPLGVEIEYEMTWHADLEEWVAELQDQEDATLANVFTPTHTTNNITTNNNATETPPPPPLLHPQVQAQQQQP
jgi:hypothetical protein